MAIEETNTGALVITGEHIELYRLLAQLSAMRLEKIGLKVTARSITAAVKKQYGFKGNADKVLEQFAAFVESEKARLKPCQP